MLRVSKVCTLLLGILTLLSVVVDRAEASTILQLLDQSYTASVSVCLQFVMECVSGGSFTSVAPPISAVATIPVPGGGPVRLLLSQADQPAAVFSVLVVRSVRTNLWNQFFLVGPQPGF